MALTECPECNKEMSDKANACPHCGAPNAAISANEPKSKHAFGGAVAIGIGALVLFVTVATCGRNETQKTTSSQPGENLADKVDPKSNQAMGALINMNGYLCARVTSVRHVSGDTYFVDCIETRNGSGTSHYSVDLETGRVTRRF